MSGFSGLKSYQDFRRRDWFEKGYILLNPQTGHKAYIFDYELLKKLQAKFTPAFYSEAKPYKGRQSSMSGAEKRKLAERFADYEFEDMKDLYKTADIYRQPISFFFKRKSDSEKQSINYPIQATGSMCLRFSLIYFFNWLREKGYLGQVKICIPPYDEINCEAPTEIGLEVAHALYDCMVRAGAIFCTRCKLDADISWARLLDENGEEVQDEKGNPIELKEQLPTYWIH